MRGKYVSPSPSIVLDFSETLSGAFAGRLLGGLAANVIMVEPAEGSPTRSLPPLDSAAGSGESFASHFVNAGKRSIAVAYAHSGSAALIYDLLAAADIVIGDTDPPTEAAVDFPSIVRRTNPSAVVVWITPFGRTQPYSPKDCPPPLIRYSSSGSLALNGRPGLPPLMPGYGLSEYMPGVVAAICAIAWRRHVSKTNSGQLVDLSAAETDHFTSVYSSVTAAYSGKQESRPVASTRNFGIFECADGHIGIHSLFEQSMLERLFIVLGLPSEYANPPLADSSWDAWLDERRSLIANRVRTMPGRPLVRQALEAHVPFGMVNYVPDLLHSFESLNSDMYFASIQHPITGQESFPIRPIRLEDPFSSTSRAPLLGEHTVDVLREIGYADAQIEKSCMDGVCIQL